MTTPLLPYVSRFDSGGEIVEFVQGGYKESWLWCSLSVGSPSRFVAPSDERLALPMSWRGTSLSTVFSVFVPIYLFGQGVVVDVEGMAFYPTVVVVWRGIVGGCTRISSQ